MADSALLAGVSDPEGVLLVRSVSVDHGTVTRNENDGWTITPDAKFSGSMTLSYTVEDPLGGRTSFTTSIEFVSSGSDPVLSEPSAVLDYGTEDTDYIVSAEELLQGFTDADNDPLSVEGLVASNASVHDNGDGTYTITPDADYFGTVGLSYFVTDGQGGLVPATQTIFFDAVNDVPKLTGTPVELAHGTEDEDLTITHAELFSGFTDKDDDPLFVSDVTVSSGQLVSAGEGGYLYTPDADFNGEVTFSYIVTDGIEGVRASRTLVIDGVNDAPVLQMPQLPQLKGSEDKAALLTVADLIVGFTDVDGDKLGVTNLKVDRGTIEQTGEGDYVYTPDPDFNGIVTVSYLVTDGNGGTAAMSRPLFIEAVNDAPVLRVPPSPLPSGSEDEAALLTVAELINGFTDPDGDALGVTGVKVDRGSITQNSEGDYVYQPEPNFSGMVTVTYQVTDGNGGLTRMMRPMLIEAVNDAPVLLMTPLPLPNGTEDKAALLTVAELTAGFTDAEGDMLDVTGVTVDRGTIEQTGEGDYVYRPEQNFNGIVTVSYTVTDGNGGTAAISRPLLISAVNDAPVLQVPPPPLPSGFEDKRSEVRVADLIAGFTDVENDKLGVTNLTVDRGAIASDGRGNYFFRPDPNFNGMVTLSYQVTDGNGGLTPMTRSLLITAINDTPMLGRPQAPLPNGTEDKGALLTVAELIAGFSDADNDTLGVTGLLVDRGTIAQNSNGDYVYSPEPNFNGVVTVSYMVTDGNGGNVPVTRSLVIDAVNDAPTSKGFETQTLVNGKPFEVNLAAGFAEIDAGDALTFSALMKDGSPLPAWLSLDPRTGLLTSRFVSAPTGPMTIVVTATDRANESVAVDVALSVVSYGVEVSGTESSNVISPKSTAAGQQTVTEYDDTIHTFGGADSIDGGGGADEMHGGTGSDTYFVDNVGDQTVELANEGIDRVLSSVSYTLTNHVEYLTLTGTNDIAGTGNDLRNILTGNAGSNVLSGMGGDDSLDGGAGADLLIGGAGNDSYAIDNEGDKILELANEGTDQVLSSVSFVLSDNVENLTLTGVAGISGTGNSIANKIVGNSGANTIFGLGGDDTIDGGAGADMMHGGAGNDSFTVESIGDQVFEAANEGLDRVVSSVSHTLSANVEDLMLTGTAALSGIGNDQGNRINGNSGANILEGRGGDDTIDGGAGADTMSGGAGNDSFTVDNLGDSVGELADEGTDRVTSSVTFALGEHVENLTLVGSKALNGTGNGLANILIGNAGANILAGGLGSDTLTGGSGADAYVFNTELSAKNIDRIVDFKPVDDTMWLYDLTFASLSAPMKGTAALLAENFHIGSSALTADHHIVYDKAAGKLYYDADGAGGDGQVQFATVSVGTALTLADFLIV